MKNLLTTFKDRKLLKSIDAVGIRPNASTSYSYGQAHNRSFPIASVTKPFTASLLIELMDEAGLHLSTKIDTIDPKLKLPYSFSVEDLLCHRSRLLPHPWAWIYLDCSRKEFIHHRLPSLPFEKGPGTFRYSNIMYALAGWLCEKLSGQSWERLISEKTSLKHMDKNWHKHCPPAYQRTDKGLVQMPPFSAEKNHPIAPASECMSTAQDLAIWAETLLAQPPCEAWEEKILIKKQRPSNILGPLHYGLGWRIETLHGLKHVWHSGTCSGYSSLVSILPEKQLGFVALTNTNNSVDLLTSLAFTHYEKELGLENQDWLKILFREGKKKSRKRITNPSAFPLDGKFVNKGYGNITAKNGILNYNGSDQIQWLGKAVYFPSYEATIPATLKKNSIHVQFYKDQKPIVFRSSK